MPTTAKEHAIYRAWMRDQIAAETCAPARKCLEETLARAESHWAETHPGAK
jgi:hypothetical protein